jgi:predicted acylesterase/phospholipase RssA
MGLRGMFGAERALKRQMFGGDARPGFSTVMIEAFNIMQDRLTRMRLAGDPPDVHITPRISGMSAGSISIAPRRRSRPARLPRKRRSSRSSIRSPR